MATKADVAFPRHGSKSCPRAFGPIDRRVNVDATNSQIEFVNELITNPFDALNVQPHMKVDMHRLRSWFPTLNILWL